MITYNGGRIGNLIKHIDRKDIYVTDTFARATRYANAQAGEVVSLSLDQEQAEGTAILEVECNVQFRRRPESHQSLDHAEAVARRFKVKSATLRFRSNEKTVYGSRHTGYMNREQVVDFLNARGIQVIIT